jgi:Calx-beta domain
MRNSVSRRARRHARFACAIESMESRVLLSTVADWTFESDNTATAGPFSPEVGSGTASATHTTGYNAVAGNGSIKSWSSNGWVVGDFWQFKVSTAGLNNITFQYDQNSSSTGPDNFQAEYSTDGTTFTNVGSQTSIVSGITWSSGGTPNASSTFTPDLSAPAVQTAISNNATVYFRIADATTKSVNGGTVAPTGTDRIDNVIITGQVAAVPVIGSVSVTPNPVIVNNGTTVTLTANNVTDSNPSAVLGVNFYLGSASGTLLGAGTQSGSNWSLAGVSTAGLPVGTTTYVAVATDSSLNPVATSAPASGTLTVLGTTQFSFSTPTYTANEADGTATITVNVSYPSGVLSTGPTSVTYATSDGSHFTTGNPQFDGAAVAGVDYTAETNTLNFTAGQTTPDTFTVPLNDIKTFSTYSDGVTTVTRILNLTLSNPTGTNASLGTNGTATLTISENTVTTALGTDSPSGTTTASFAAPGGSSNLFIPISVTSHGGFNGSQMPEIEFGAASTVFPNTYSAAAIDSVRLSLYNTAVTGTNFAGTPGAFDVYLLTNDSTAATSLTYTTGTGPTVLGTPPEGGAIFVGTGTFTNNVLGYNDYTFDNLSAPVQTALGNYFNAGGSPPIRFVIIPHLGSSIAADWQGNNAAQPTQVPKLQLLVEKSNNIPERFTVSESGSNTPLGTINKGDNISANDSLTFTVTRTGNAAASFDSDSVTVPYTLTGPDVNGVDYILSGANAPATSTGTTGTITFAAGVDTSAPLTVTTIGAPNTANVSADRTFTLTLGTPVPTGSLHVGLLGTPSSEVVTIHDARTDNVSSTNSYAANPVDIATILEPGPGTVVGGPRTGANGVAEWQEEGVGSNTATTNFASYAIANFNDTLTDPNNFFAPPAPVGTINSITLNTVSSGPNSFDTAGAVDLYLVQTPAAFSALTFNPNDPGGIDPSQITIVGLLGTFTSNPSQSSSSYTTFSLTKGSSVLSTLANDLNNTSEFTIILAPHDASSKQAMSWVGDVLSNTTLVNAPTLSFNYTPQGTVVNAPTWLAPNSTATAFSIYGNSLAVSGTAAQIIADPGGDDPIISGSSAGNVLNIPSSAGNTIHIGGVNLTGGASVVLNSVTGRTATNHRVLVVAGTGNFAIDSTSKLDLKDNDALFLGGTLSTVNTSLTSGFNGSGAWWTGGGITSSVAAATPALTTLGVESNDNGHSAPLTTTFDGQVTSDGDVLVKYTYVGDANLSGTLTAADYIAIDNGFNGSLTGFANGDFNYDGVINGDDYTLIDNSYNTQATNSVAHPLSKVATPPANPPSTSVFATGIPIADSSTTDSLFGTTKKKSLVEDLLG